MIVPVILCDDILTKQGLPLLKIVSIENFHCKIEHIFQNIFKKLKMSTFYNENHNKTFSQIIIL